MEFPRALATAILSTASDAIVAADKDGIIFFWNPGAERIFGYASGDAVGRSLDIIIPERLRARHWEGYRHVMAGGESRYGHGDLLAVPAIRKDGAGLSVEFTIVPLRDEAGALTGLAAIMRDVTRRFEETRELKRRLAAAEKV
jgi:PAS domain S-box-containing protein